MRSASALFRLGRTHLHLLVRLIYQCLMGITKDDYLSPQRRLVLRTRMPHMSIRVHCPVQFAHLFSNFINVGAFVI